MCPWLHSDFLVTFCYICYGLNSRLGSWRTSKTKMMSLMLLSYFSYFNFSDKCGWVKNVRWRTGSVQGKWKELLLSEESGKGLLTEAQ